MSRQGYYGHWTGWVGCELQRRGRKSVLGALGSHGSVCDRTRSLANERIAWSSVTGAAAGS